MKCLIAAIFGVTFCAFILRFYCKKKPCFFTCKPKEDSDKFFQLEKMVSLGALSAGLAHEINNPLTFLITDLNILLKQIEDTNSDTKAMLQECLEGANRIKVIVHDLLNFSHPSPGKKGLNNVNLLLDAVVRILWNEIKYKVDLVRDYKASSLVWIDPSLMGHVFLNIIINAQQAIENKGAITISTYEDERDVFIKISDTGCGIKPGDIKKIFEPFYTTKGGTGLGLAVCKGIVAGHSGKIVVGAEDGKGASFIVSLPKGKCG